MLKLKHFLIGSAAVVALGAVTAVAGDKIVPNDGRTQTMTVQLPGGGVAHIEYSGPVKPRVTLERDVAAFDPFGFAPQVRFGAPLDPFWFWGDDFALEMQRVRAMMDDVLAGAPLPSGGTLLQAGDGAMAPGSFSYSFTSTTSGGKTCARSVQVTASAGGKPEVVERTSGDCDEPAKPAQKPGEATAL